MFVFIHIVVEGTVHFDVGYATTVHSKSHLIATMHAFTVRNSID